MSKIRARRKGKNFFITGSNVAGLVNATTVSSSIFTKMSQSFADGEHLIDDAQRENQGAILFMLQELQDDVDDIYTQVSASQYAPLANSELQATTGSYTILNLGGTNITSTATELNIMDGNTVASAITPVDADRVVLNDGGTMRQVTLTKLATYFDDEITNMPNLANIGTDLKVEGEISSSGGFIGGATQNTGSFDFPGAIVGYNVQGLNVSYASYTLTTTMAVPDAGLNVCFVAPKSGIVEIEVQIRADGGSSGTGDLFFGLSDNATYNAVQSYYEQNVLGFPRFDHMSVVHKWIVPSLTPGTKYQYWLGAKTTNTGGSPFLAWGGNNAIGSADFVMKATALPSNTEIET